MTLKADIESDVEGVFLDTDEFAEECVYKKKGSESTIALKGIFDSVYNEAQPQNGMFNQAGRKQTRHVTLRIRESAVTGGVGEDGEGDEVTVRGVTYLVKTNQSDGTGFTVLQLHKKREE